MPTSTIVCVNKGNSKLSIEPTINANTIVIKYFLYGDIYFASLWNVTFLDVLLFSFFIANSGVGVSNRQTPY